MLSYSFMQNAFLISLAIAVLCPCIGIFLVLRRCSMIGDTLAHASLAGIALGLLFRQSPVLAAFLFTSAAGAVIEWLRSYFQKYTDLILTIVLSLSVGTALTIISSGRIHANVDSFLFGSVLTVGREDLLVTGFLTLIAALLLCYFYHSLLYIAYDEETARIAGVHVKAINYVFSILVAAAVAVSIRIVGVLVISSLIALPVASALQLKQGFRRTLAAAIGFSFFDILAGLFLSWYTGTAPGGLTALLSGLVLLAVIGVQWGRMRLAASSL